MVSECSGVQILAINYLSTFSYMLCILCQEIVLLALLF